MEKKSVSATILVLYLAIIFAVIGACFSSFVFSKTKIEVEKINVIASSGVLVCKDLEMKNKADVLKLSNLELGLKPATGELDAETQIPSTITDEGATEGYYGTLFVESETDVRVVVKNIEIETKKNKIEANEQRKNIFVSIKGFKNTTKSLEEDEIILVELQDISEPEKLVFLVWLGNLAGDELEGAKINFSLEFQAI